MNEVKMIRQLTAIGLVGNLLLSACKLCAGILGHSGALMSDSVHSLADVFATLIAMAGTRLSRKGADRRHPYGYGRYESLSAMLLGIILFLTGVGIGSSALRMLLLSNSTPRPTGLALAVAGFCVCTKELIFFGTSHLAKKLRSDAFLAEAWHHQADALASAVSLVGIGGSMLDLSCADSIASLCISLCVSLVGVRILRRSIAQMLDIACSPETEAKICALALSQSSAVFGVCVKTRQHGSQICADIELTVSEELSVLTLLSISEEVKRAVRQAFPSVRMLTVQPVLPAKK